MASLEQIYCAYSGLYVPQLLQQPGLCDDGLPAAPPAGCRVVPESSRRHLPGGRGSAPRVGMDVSASKRRSRSATLGRTKSGRASEFSTSAALLTPERTNNDVMPARFAARMS